MVLFFGQGSIFLESLLKWSADERQVMLHQESGEKQLRSRYLVLE